MACRARDDEMGRKKKRRKMEKERRRGGEAKTLKGGGVNSRSEVEKRS